MQHNRTMKFTSKQGGFLNLPNDSFAKTIAVALTLCLVCSVVVSTAATLLKPAQLANKLVDKKQNIVAVSGLDSTGKTLDEVFTNIETRLVDLRSGEYSDAAEAETYDQVKASRDPKLSIKLDKKQDIASIGRRAHYANVYLVKNDDKIQKIILPIKGYGLWSTMYGFVALESDARTVSAITFYDHGETPGLGGEIENSRWQQSWQGKIAIDGVGNPVLTVLKGKVDPNSDNVQHQVDGLAGATLTSNGVTNLIQFWLGENGFGPYLNSVRAELSADGSAYSSAISAGGE